MSRSLALPDQLWVHAVAVEAPYVLNAPYVRRYFAPVFGPSAILLAAYFGDEFETTRGFMFDLSAEHDRFGLSQSLLIKGLSRLIQFKVATYDAKQATLGVQDHLAEMNPHTAERLLSAHQYHEWAQQKKGETVAVGEQGEPK